MISEEEESELRGRIGEGGVGSDTNSRKNVESYEKVMAAEDSGGLSANKVDGQEEEGNIAPFPDTVMYVCHFHSKYAFKAVKLAGITSIGVRGKDSVCVITQKKNKLLDQMSVTHIFLITKYLGLLATSMT
ncbi:hypothetical protein IFM89_005536, partial [Coptis chinensis]